MSEEPLLNQVTSNLAPYPMEELKRIKLELSKDGREIFDFGTGDPRIPLWPPICEAISNSVSLHSQYPSISGLEVLNDSHEKYLSTRFNIKSSSDLICLPSRGSKEAIFHIALSIIGRANGRKRVLYPDPGYPVYKSSILFAGGIPHPMKLTEENSYLLEPWHLPSHFIKDCAALWVNYPHNPSGTCVDESYWQKLISWCHKHDVLLLSDDCYVDIFDTKIDANDELKSKRPRSPIEFSLDRVISFFSLSKRSGLTGYRAGFIAGDARILKQHSRARANFGLAMPECIQMGAATAWNDEEHVKDRRKIFSKKIELVSPKLIKMGLLDKAPEATFYIWCKVPSSFKGDDIAFCLNLAKKAGIIASPSSWLSEGVKGYFRLSLVIEDEKIIKALDIFENLSHT